MKIKIAILVALCAIAIAATVVRTQARTSAQNPSAAPATAANDRHRVINAASPGERVDIAKFVVPGKINVFDFYSKYCGPCMRVSPVLEKLSEKDANVVINKVDINRPDVRGIDWEAPIVQQYGLTSVPHFVVYDAQGKKIAEGEKAMEIVAGLVEKANIEM